MLGGVTANFWRLVIGTILLGLLAHLTGMGLGGAALPVFLVSGLIGFGLGDAAYFHALPHLGPRLTILMVQCLAAPIAALVEWVWLDTSLTGRQMAFGAMTLAGVAVALAPAGRARLLPSRGCGRASEPVPSQSFAFSRQPSTGFVVHGAVKGLFFGLVAAAGQGIGAVLSRKAYSISARTGENMDSISAAYQRIVGGVGVAGVLLAWVWMKQRRRGFVPAAERPDWKKAWPWVAANALAGSVLGVSCYQWALKTSGTGIVLPIVATAPIVILPFSYFMDGEKPSRRSFVGGVIAVAGVIGLTTSTRA